MIAGILIVIGALRTVVSKDLEELEIKERIEIMYNAALLKDQLEYFEESWRYEKTCCLSESRKKKTAV